MTHPVWPKQLVKFERAGWQRQPQDGRRRSQGDAAPPRFRRRFSAVASNISLVLRVSRSNLTTFWRFYDQECAGGSSLFWMPDPSTDGWPMLTSDGQPMLTSDGRPILLSSRWLCTWGDETPVETVHVQTEFKLSFNVWVMP